jgi:hypothetical protein
VKQSEIGREALEEYSEYYAINYHKTKPLEEGTMS